MLRRKLRQKIASGLLTLTLVMSLLAPQNVKAYSNNDRISSVKALAEKYNQEFISKDAELKENPIREGVDTTTEEEQNIIVEFNSLPLIMQEALNNGVKSKKITKEVEDEHKVFEKFLVSKSKEKSSTYSIKYSYYNTYNGVAMTIKGTDIESLLESGVVKAIWKDETVKIDPVSTEVATYSVKDDSSRMVTSTPLVGVDKLRNEGITGEGIKVGVIDTGIDYNHPDLKDNYKGGYDYIDDDSDPMETTYDDWIESGEEEYAGTSSYYTYHGTHVAGTIGATGGNTESEFAVTGLAPDVDLYAYRVLGPYGSGGTSGIIAAIEQSVEDGMDVINLSLGIGTTDILYPGSVACNNATLAGVVTVVANGNAGPEFSTLGAPATSPLAISVGASSTDIAVETFDIKLSNGKVVDGRLFARNFKPIDEFTSGEYEIVYAGLGNEEEIENANVKGKVVLIDRGEITFADKIKTAYNAGAAGVIIANNIPGEELNLYLGEDTKRVITISITKEEGQELKSLIEEANAKEEALDVEKDSDKDEVIKEETLIEDNTLDKEEVSSNEEKVSEEENTSDKVTTDEEANLDKVEDKVEADKEEVLKVKFDVTGKTKTIADILASFSSRGPASDETIKPDVVAPGDGIFSTYPEYVNSPEDGIDYSNAYSRISGTSMASPHVAGIVALMLQNNKDMTPEEVKVALMNSCVDLKGNYPINAVGAGRVDAYKAVHSKVSFSVLDTTNSLDENSKLISLDYITGSLAFDRFYVNGNDNEKSLNLKVENSSDINKTFNISVKYLGEESLAQNATENGVILDIKDSINVKANDISNFNATIKIPSEAAEGRYEGYVIFTNVDDSSEVFKMPFSATYMKPGVKSITLSRYAVSNDLELMHFAKLSGITAYIQVSSPLDYMEIYVKDYETNERIGLVGFADLSYIQPGYGNGFYAVDSRASYFPVDENGEVTYIKKSLTDGKYKVEFVAHSDEVEEVFTTEYGFLVDNEDVTMKVDKEPGVYEITEDMLTTEEYMGEEHTAFWLHGNVDDNSIAELKEMGYEASKQDIIVSGFLNGMPRFGLNIDENGDYMIGFEESDISNNVMEFSPMPTDMATSQNLFLCPRYFFVKEGTPYTSVNLDKDNMIQGEDIVATIGVNNLIAGSTFKFNLGYMRAFEVIDIKLNDELQKIVDENGYNVKIEKSIDGYVMRSLQLNVYITDKDGNKVELSDDINLLDVTLKLVDDSECEFYKEYIQCNYVDVLDKDDNPSEMSYTSTYEGVNIKQGTSSVRTIQVAQGIVEASQRNNYTEELGEYIWVEDNNGNKYELEYYPNNDEYVALDLPISTEEYKVISNAPGHFRKEALFIPSRTVNGETYGKMYYLLGSEFYMYALAGDVNGDDVIDIKDAIEVSKYYGEKVDYKEAPVDFNFDGLVNADDMDYIIYNYLMTNEQNSKAPEGLEEYEGKTLEDILTEIGYYDEVRLNKLTISETNIDLELTDPNNNTKQLLATMNPENVPNIGLVWSSRNEKIVTVDQNGLVTAVGPGTTVVKVSASDGSVALNCYVTVTKNGEIPTLDSVTAVNPNLDVYVGDEFEFELNLNNEDAVLSSLEFISSADSIVSVVDGKGVANSVGKAIVTASINGGSSYVTWEINVKEKENDDSDNGSDDNNSGENGSEDGGNTNNPGNEDIETPDKDNGNEEIITPDGNNNSNNNGQNTDGNLPITGGRDVLPIAVLGIIMIVGGSYFLKRKKVQE